MKLSYEDKLEIYTLRKQGYSLRELARRYCVTKLTVDYMIRLMERYGVEIVSHKYRFLLTMPSPIKELFLIGFPNTRKTGILLLRNNEGDRVRWDVNQRKLVKK